MTMIDHLHVFLGYIDSYSNHSGVERGNHPNQMTCMSVANMAVSSVVCLLSLLFSRAWFSKHFSSPQWFKL